MRTIASRIWDIWYAGGPAIGSEGAPHGRVTVEPDWYLNTEAVTNFQGSPVRWWQRDDNSQIEYEMPNIVSIETTRSLDQDAATCTITLDNVWVMANNEISLNDAKFGKPGYFTFNRGESSDATARWGSTENSWHRLIVPNALLRTYQGYGGKDKAVGEAITDGNIVLTGVWLVDEIRINTDGHIEITCRDMAKLLIDQQVYPPMMPSSMYPLAYCRWTWRAYQGVHKDLLFDTDPGDAFATGFYVSGGCTNYGGNVPEPNYPDYWLNEPGNGYWLVTNDGNVWPFGNNEDYGDSTGDIYGNPIWGIKSTPDGRGYYTLRRDGTIEAHGDAVHHGDWPHNPAGFNSTSCFTVKSDGSGYWIGDYTGNVAGFGVSSHGGWTNPSNPLHLESPNWWDSNVMVDIEADPGSDGYWLLSSEGAVQALGGAAWLGEPRGATWPAAIGGDDSVVRTYGRLRANPRGGGYWVIDQIGQVHAYGTCKFYGQTPGNAAYGAGAANTEFANPNFPDYISDLIPTPTGLGYWLVGILGGVYPFGDAVYLGDLQYDFTVYLRQDGNYSDYSDIVKELLLWAGWWLKTDHTMVTDWIQPDFDDSTWERSTQVELVLAAKPGSPYHWLIPIAADFPDDTAYMIWADGGTYLNAPAGDVYFRKHFTAASSGTYDIYWLTDNSGTMYVDGTQFSQSNTFTSTTHFQLHLDAGPHVLAAKVTNAVQETTNPGGLAFAVYKNGVLVCHSDADTVMDPYPVAGDPGASLPVVYGNIESTGAWAEECIDPGIFDKKPPIDGINQLKEIVGYNFWIDEEGAARFESPNIWSKGNFFENGTHVEYVPDIQEDRQITNYGISYVDAPIRSEIVISSSDPTQPLDDTVTTRYVPPQAPQLRGMVKPAVWVNEVFTNQTEQDLMAELIALQSWLAQRQGSVTILANPAIQINDQVRIWEEQTAETYIHYVRGVTSTMDLIAGTYLQTLTTHWMGDGTKWAVDLAGGSGDPNGDTFTGSANLAAYVENGTSRSQQIYRINKDVIP